MKTVHERIITADLKAAKFLADANQQQERGNHERAEVLYEKAQKWMDVSNTLRGNGDGSES